ncbi:MAG: hypothetical protein ACSLFE_09690 [Gemmatimonadaceae bacterium]
MLLGNGGGVTPVPLHTPKLCAAADHTAPLLLRWSDCPIGAEVCDAGPRRDAAGDHSAGREHDERNGDDGAGGRVRLGQSGIYGSGSWDRELYPKADGPRLPARDGLGRE